MRMRTLVALALLGAPALGRAQVSLGLRAGYAIPGGDAANLGGLGLFKQSDLFKGVVPLQIEGWWRMTPALAAGLYASYGFASAGSLLQTSVCDASTSCAALRDLRAGAQATWSFGHVGPVEPWVGIGGGYESAHFEGSEATYPNSQPPPATISGDLRGTFRGWEASAQGGADFRLASQVAVGPFVQGSIGQYRVQDVAYVAPVPGNGGIPSPKPHWFITLGLRGTYDL